MTDRRHTAMPRVLTHVDDLSHPPEIGRRYLVPTVLYPWLERQGVWPVLGPLHTDAEHLKFPFPHYHIDPRFLTKQQWRFAFNYSSMTVELTLIGVPLYSRTGRPFPPIVNWPLRCLRPLPDHQVGAGLYVPPKPGWSSLYSAYQGLRAAKGKCGWICPHRGYALGSVAPGPDGVLICPVHGLRIDAATGAVLPPVIVPSAIRAARRLRERCMLIRLSHTGARC